MCTLVPLNKTLWPNTYTLEPHKCTVFGRSVIEKIDVRLQDPAGFVSRKHCSFTFLPDEDTVEVINISALNRTFVGNNLEKQLQPKEKYKLRNGDYVSLGGTYFQRKEDETNVRRNPFIFIVNIAHKKEEWENAPESVHCPICVTYLDKPVALSCGHLYCLRCIDHWKRKTSNPTCPMCRESISLSDSLTVHQGVQKCIDYLRTEKEENALFQCKTCARECQTPSLSQSGELYCEACVEGSTPEEPTIQRIVDDVVECRNKKRKRDDL